MKPRTKIKLPTITSNHLEEGSNSCDGYESTLGISSLMPKREFKMIVKEKKFYMLKVLNKGTHRA